MFTYNRFYSLNNFLLYFHSCSKILNAWSLYPGSHLLKCEKLFAFVSGVKTIGRGKNGHKCRKS